MILVDTGPLVAIANRDDPNHQRCAEWYEATLEPLLITSLVLTEVCYLLEREGGPAVEAAFVRTVRDEHLRLESLTKPDLDRMATLIDKYADLRLGAADASVVAIAERKRITTIATLDARHFSVLRPAHVPAFTLLPD